MEVTLSEQVEIEPLSERVTFSAKCIKGKEGSLACNNSKCKKYAFVCASRACECRVEHRKCLLTCPLKVLDIIEEKRVDSKGIVESISNIFDKWIDEISRTREKMQDQLRNWGMSDLEKTYFEAFETETYDAITGEMLSKINQQTYVYEEDNVKERLIGEIEAVGENNQAEITDILQKFIHVVEKQQFFMTEEMRMEKQVVEEIAPNLDKWISDLVEDQKFKKKDSSRRDFNAFINDIREVLRKDFFYGMKRYSSNRKYLTQSPKIKEKFFGDYIKKVNEFKEVQDTWSKQIEEKMKALNTKLDLGSFITHYREYFCETEVPFSVDSAMELRRAINLICRLVDFISENGATLRKKIRSNGAEFVDDMCVALFCWDEMSQAQGEEADEVEIIWTIIRFSNKLKDEMAMLTSSIKELNEGSYEYELNTTLTKE